jgi:translocator protein
MRHGGEKIHPSGVKKGLGLLGWLFLTFSAAWFGARFEPGVWYAALDLPVWSPPSWVFGPVWTILYTLMAVAAWLVWVERGFERARVALSLYLFQLVLNGLWSWLFFGLRNPGLALLEIFILWGAILGTLISFLWIRRLAGYLFIPYLLWVSFALVLNFAIWRMNE